jgi:molybdenum cofactor cytidylyltransferase
VAEIYSILLAAGNSRRMGSPKQLLPWGNSTIIEHQIQTLKTLTENVIVVLGAYAERISPIVEKYEVEIVLNPDWETGMGSSIARSIRKIITVHASAEGAMITLVDQPLVTAKHYRNLLSAFNHGERNIVISSSSTGWEGVPVVFDSCYFEELAILDGEAGAKKIINLYRERVKVVNCNENLDDIDTPEKYQVILEAYNNLLA